MSLDASDFVDAALTEQARRNSAIDDTDINALITDFQAVTPVALVGFQAEANVNTSYVSPHTWGDGHSFWGFVQWGALSLVTRWGRGATWGDGHVWGT